MKRPKHVRAPDYLSKSPPMPRPAPPHPGPGEEDPLGLDPTRYGDWEKKGVAIDF